MDSKNSNPKLKSNIFTQSASFPPSPKKISTPPTPPTSPFVVKNSCKDDNHQVRSELALFKCSSKAMENCRDKKIFQVDELKELENKNDDKTDFNQTKKDTFSSALNENESDFLTCNKSDSLFSEKAIETFDNNSEKPSLHFHSKKSCFESNNDPLYHLKWINWQGNKCPIITQNENGPCPLLALMNVLILKNQIKLPSMIEVVTANQLIEYLGDCILENIPKNLNEEAQLNYEQNMHDAIAILPKLQTGLDVNVRFTGVSHFEYTPELILFDLLHIPLYHGWIVDSEDIHTQSAIGNCGYNQLVDKIISNKSSLSSELVTQAMIAEEFLGKTASQLTNAGLLQLNSTLKDGELSVLFRNNHFITLFKYKDQLYQLMTDQGFLTESRVVWETLDNIENDGCFVDAEFIPVSPKPTEPLTREEQLLQVDQDYLIALSIQAEQKKEIEKQQEWETYKTKSGLSELTDEELARKLQDEEKKLHLQQQQNQESLNQSLDSRQKQSQLSNKRNQNVHSKKNYYKDNDGKQNSKCTVV